MPADPSNPENWSGEDKLAVVIETAALNEQELSEYCRKKGLYPEQIARWKEISISGHDTPGRLSKAERRELQQLKKRSRKTQKELKSKEKALAEAAALLVLKKSPGHLGGRRGRIIPEARQVAIGVCQRNCPVFLTQHHSISVLLRVPLSVDSATLQ